jgi:hypothetical protein
MPAFLALALLSNLTPDDYPQLPPHRVCQERFKIAWRDWQAAVSEDYHRQNYDPKRMPRARGSYPPSNDPKVVERWRYEASIRESEAILEANLWHWALRVRSLELSAKERASGARSCRRHLGEALWQKGNWWK